MPTKVDKDNKNEVKNKRHTVMPAPGGGGGHGGGSDRNRHRNYRYGRPQRHEAAEPSSRPNFVRSSRPGRDHVSRCVKYSLFSFNFLFWLTGMGIAALGLWISIDIKEKQIRDVLDVFFDPAILMSIAGCIIFFIGFFGCLGALRENICLLQTFHVILTIMLVVEVILAVIIFVFYYVPSVRQHLGFWDPEATLRHAIVRYRDDDDLRDLIDIMQREFECCGVSNTEEGYTDWQQNIYFNCSEDNPSVEKCGVPHSCCKISEGDMINVMCGFGTTNKERVEVQEQIYTQGCVKGFGSWLEHNTIIVGAGCLAAMIPQLLGICFARTLVEQIKLQKSQWRR